MIRRLSWLRAEGTDPYRNLALEEALLGRLEEGEVLLYLWQNRHTVVIGRNQNCWKECRVTLLEEEGGHLARRLSGGGAVYHDLGNLNFTFLAPRQDYSVERQTRVILEAVRRCGIRAEKSGRNDLTCEGKKFSGNAYYETASACYHHGTLLLDTDPEKIGRYLSVSREKLRAKSVDSVRSRVGNLRDWAPALTLEELEEALLEAFGQEYGGKAAPLEPGRIPPGELEGLRQKYAGEAWKYSPRLPFSYQLEKRFDWGEVQLQLEVKEGRLARCLLFSDGLDPAWIEASAARLAGCEFRPQALAEALKELPADTPARLQMGRDLAELLRQAL